MNTISKQQLIGYVAITLLLIGLFLPVIELPLMGAFSLWNMGNLNGLLPFSASAIAYGLLGLIIASYILVFFNHCRLLILSAIISISAFSFIAYHMSRAGEQIQKNVLASFLMDATNTSVGVENITNWVYVPVAGIMLILFISIISPLKE